MSTTLLKERGDWESPRFAHPELSLARSLAAHDQFLEDVMEDVAPTAHETEGFHHHELVIRTSDVVQELRPIIDGFDLGRGHVSVLAAWFRLEHFDGPLPVLELDDGNHVVR